jgi:hypothetical protein
MSPNQNLKEEILDFIKKYSNKEGKSPPIREISDKIKGVNRSNFYQFYPGGIAEACKAAGVTRPTKRMKDTSTASKARKTRKNDKFPIISLDSESSQKAWVISTLENKDPQILIADLLEQAMLFRTEYNLENDDVIRFVQLLKSYKKLDVSNKQIINNMRKLTKLGIGEMNSYKYNELIKLINFMTKNLLTPNDLKNVYLSQNEMYRKGYLSCVNFLDAILKIGLIKYGNIDLDMANFISRSITSSLIGNAPYRAPPI